MAIRLADAVRGVCTFEFYRDGALHYRTETGLVFPVPIEDAGSATFGRVERGVLLMRWIRRALDQMPDPTRADARTEKRMIEAIESYEGSDVAELSRSVREAIDSVIMEDLTALMAGKEKRGD